VIDRLALAWQPRAVPLVARAVAGTGATARALGHQLAQRDDAALAALTAVAGDDVLVVLGDDLPWVDGVTYLGRDDAAPALLLPTALAPSVPPAVLAAAISRRAHGSAFAVLIAPPRLVPCGAARAIDRGPLAAWLASSEQR
jgi:hypothetical protein